jgi:hypothetical protein
MCVQRFDDSLNSAIHTTYRISLRSSSTPESTTVSPSSCPMSRSVSSMYGRTPVQTDIELLASKDTHPHIIVGPSITSPTQQQQMYSYQQTSPILPSVVATGGVYKGQGRNQRMLMTFNTRSILSKWGTHSKVRCLVYLKCTVCRQHRLRPPQRPLHTANTLDGRPIPQTRSYLLSLSSEQVQDVGGLNLHFGKCGLARGRLPIRSGPNLAPTSLGAARVQIPQIPRTMLTKRMRLSAGMWRCQVH